MLEVCSSFSPHDKDKWKKTALLWSPTQPIITLWCIKKKKKKTSYSKSEIRKLKIQNFGLLPLTGCFHKFISATEGRNNQLFKNLNRKKKIYKKQVNLAPIEER